MNLITNRYADESLQLWSNVVALVLIAGLSMVIIGACVACLPIRIIIDRSFKKQQSLCHSCAGLDRQQWLELIYLRNPGINVCTKCKRSYSVQRESAIGSAQTKR